MKKIILFFFLCSSISLFSQEICDNGIDDDFDGLIDLNDDDCICGDIPDVESLIPNYSFEERSCCPTGFSQLDCADDWLQASGATSDYFNFCDFDAYPAGAPMLPLPGEPGGEGFTGFIVSSDLYLEYIGTNDLESPLLVGTDYVLNIYTAWSTGSTELELSLFGSPNVDDLPWAGTACPEDIDGWELLAAQDVVYTDDGAWQSISFIFTPTVDIYSIAIGGPCSSDGEFSYYYLDEITLLDYDSYYGLSREGGWCSGDLVLTAESDTIGGSWQWYKDGVAIVGETSESFSPVSHGGGLFSAVYFIGDYCKRVDYESPEDGLEVDFEFISGCYGTTTEFINLTEDYDPEGVFWDWDFGDGDDASEESPDHFYLAEGTYDVSLIGITSDSTCNDTITTSIFIGPIPVAALDFTGPAMYVWAGYTVSCANNPIYFEDISTVDAPSTITEWLWYFGDGSTSEEENPIFTYTDPGIYDVSLVVTTETGCTDSIVYEDLYITGVTSDFVTDADCMLNELTFENTAFITGPGVFEDWKWHYGDGDLGYTEDGAHIYAESGAFTVMLVATTEFGCTDTIEKIIEVYPLPEVDFEFVVDGVSSEVGGTGGCFTSEVTFNSFATIDAPSVIDTWSWVFGDGETSTEENPVHLYDEEGLYTVELTVTSNFGCESTFSMDILMTNGLAFLSNDTTICQNGTVVLNAASSDGSPHTYDWSIPGADDGGTQIIDDLTVDHWVYVTSINEAGCISPMDSVFIEVLDAITLDISVDDITCLGETVSKTVVVLGGRGDYVYNWTANGEPLPDDTPTITKSPIVTTEYCVIVSDGCETDSVTICSETYVPQPVVFTSDTTEGCEPTEILFTDLTGPDATLNQSTWYINGETLFGNPLTYLFEEAGSYSIELDVLSPEGCITSGSITNYITIHPLPTPELYASPNATNYFNTQITAANIDPNVSSSFAYRIPGGTPSWIESDSIAEFTYPELVSGEYTITLIETTEFGCVDSAQTNIIVTNDQIIYAPNAFTPDGDNLNQTWGIYIEGIDIYDFQLTLFNRWGELVWKSYNPIARWDGSYGGEIVQDGVYVWVVQAKDLENDKAYEFKGMVTVFK